MSTLKDVYDLINVVDLVVERAGATEKFKEEYQFGVALVGATLSGSFGKSVYEIMALPQNTKLPFTVEGCFQDFEYWIATRQEFFKPYPQA